MGRTKAHPRYNIVTVRVSDEHLEKIDRLVGTGTRSLVLVEAIASYLERLEETAFRERVRALLDA